MLFITRLFQTKSKWIIITLLIIFRLINSLNAFCPIKCHCDDLQLIADCTSGSLDLVPITLNPQLRELHLATNQIKSIKETLSFYSNLLLLDLTDNQLQTLGERNFNQLRSLKILKIGNNRIFQLSNQTFAGLLNLQQLYLPHNELRTLHNDVFRNLNRLRLLDLSHNTLVNLPSDVFVNLISLELLNLSHNRFDNKISTLVFDRLSSLKVLHLDKNSLQNLPDFLFRSLTQLNTLTLNHCELRNLNRNLFFGLESIKHLSISFNKFNQLSSDVFSYLENLEILELQGTALLQLPNIFTPLKSIKHLFLGYDRFLKQLTSDLFNQNTKIQSIAIEHSPSLEQIPIGLFSAQKQLVLVNFGHNALTTLLPNVFFNFTTIQRLILTGNPLHCDCSLAWLYSLNSLKTTKFIINDTAKKLPFIEDGEELERIFEKWSTKETFDLNQDFKLKNHLQNKKINIIFKQQIHPKRQNHQNEIDFNSGENQDYLNTLSNQHQSNMDNQPSYSKDQTDDFRDQYEKSDRKDFQNQNKNYHQTQQRNNENTATCFEPLSLVGRPLIELTAAELNCNLNINNLDHQSIMINGEKINFENRNPVMVIGYDGGDQQFNAEDILNNNSNSNSSGLNLFTLCFFIVLIFCLILFVILFSFIYLKRNKKEHQHPISSWILKPGGSNNATLSFQPFASFDMNQEHLNQQPTKCNTLVNPLAKLGPLPKKPLPLINSNSPLINQNNLLNSVNSSPSNTNTLNSKIKLTPQITRISNLTNSSNNLESSNKLYEQINYSGFDDKIYEDLSIEDLNELNTTNYGYQQLNSTTSTASSYLSNGLNPITYEEFLATSLMRSTTANTYGTLNSNQVNRFLSTNLNNLNNNNNLTSSNNFSINRTNNRRTLNTMAHV